MPASLRRTGLARLQAKTPCASSKGFTLLEMVLVVGLLGLLAFALVPRLSALGDLGLNRQAEQLRRDISRVQLMATSQSQRLRLAVVTDGYSVVACSDPSTCSGTPVNDPQTGAAFAVTLTDEVAFPGASQIDFDSLGRPAQAAGLLETASLLTLQRSGRSVQVEVLPLTGYARVIY